MKRREKIAHTAHQENAARIEDHLLKRQSLIRMITEREAALQQSVMYLDSLKEILLITDTAILELMDEHNSLTTNYLQSRYC